MKRNKITKRISMVDTLYGSHRVIFERDERRGYIATAPDLAGVITWGKDLAEAEKMIREAIELCIECVAEEQIAVEKIMPRRDIRRARERLTV